MNAIVRIAMLAASSSILSAVPVTWYLNNVTFTDGGRAFGNFTYDSATGALTAVNIQTTPAASTVNALSAVGGGSFTRGFPGPVFPLPSAVVFQSGGIGGNLRRSASSAQLRGAVSAQYVRPVDWNGRLLRPQHLYNFGWWREPLDRHRPGCNHQPEQSCDVVPGRYPG